MLSASSVNCAPAWIPIQNTRGAFAVGKNPYPPERISSALLSIRRKTFGDGLDSLWRLFADELQRNVQRLRTHPARLGRKTLNALEEARNPGTDFKVEIDADEYSHL